MSEIYRGYDIRKVETGGYAVCKDGIAVTSQPSLEFAQKWVDQEIKRLRQCGE